MNMKSASAIVLALVLSVAVVLVVTSRSTGQQPPMAPFPAAVPAGRYQMQLKYVPGQTFSTVFVVDSQTGECWYRDTHPESKWTSIGSPVAK